MSSEEVQSLVYHREYLLEAMTRFNVSGEEEIPDAYIAGICANIIYPKGGQAMDNYIKLISNDIKHIANNTATYLKNTTVTNYKTLFPIIKAFLNTL
uniref:Uncharacterized protein n=1 Tax=Meloidogyne hapla TaxID=6305 RepID=A0A1I8BD07_MELHA